MPGSAGFMATIGLKMTGSGSARRTWWVLPAVIALLPAFARSSTPFDAADSAHPAIRRFTSADGLPNDTINVVRLDPQGYLWVGTQNGAARFNGRKFTAIDMPDPTLNYVRDILPLPDGTVWFARQAGGPVRLQNGKLTAFDSVGGEPFGRVNALFATAEAMDAPPVIFAARHAGDVARWDGARWTKVPGPGKTFRVWKLLRTSALGPDRVLAAAEQGLFALENGRFVPVGLPEGFPAAPFNNLVETREGDRRVLWVGTYGAGVLRIQDGHLTRFGAAEGLGSELVTSLDAVEGPNGPTVWVGTRGGGLARIDGGQAHHVPLSGRALEIYSLLAPAGHDLVWVGTRGNGLFRVRRGPWRALDISSGLPSESITSLYADRGTVFVGTSRGLASFAGGRWTTLDPSGGLPAYEVQGLARTEDGSLWIATLGNGLARLDGAKLTRFDAAHGLPTDRLYSLLAEGESLWLGADTGSLYRLNAKTGAIVDSVDGLPRAEVLGMVQTGEGTVVAATRAGLVAVPRAGPLAIFRRADGLPNDEVLTVAVVGGPQGSELWAGTRGGLARTRLPLLPRARFKAVPSMPAAVGGTAVTAIVTGADGSVFLGTQRGVVRLLRRANGEFDAVLFTTVDGLPSNVCTWGSLRDEAGRVWLSTSEGVAIFDPRDDPRRAGLALVSAKPLVLDRLLVNGAERKPAPGLKLGYDENTLTIELALLSYAAEGSQYRTQLVGLERSPGAWTQEAVVNLPHVPAGKHLLRAWARDRSGVESGPIEWSFEVLPPPWRTWPAYTLYVAAAAAALAGAIRMRTAALRRRNQELEALVEERTHDLRAARDQALAGSQTKSAFLANVSHELRTPLNAILGYAEMLADDLAPTVPDAIPDLTRIQKAARHQLGLVNELLDLSKIEAGRFELHLTRFSTRRLVEDVAATARPLVAQNRNELVAAVADGLDVICADETRLRQVLLNLLGNASKFTTDGRVSLEASVDGEVACFFVTDTGVGMTAEQMERLFQPFMQASAQTGAVYGGTGLGLVIAKRFCELMGGDLTATSEPGRGSTFAARIPIEVKAAGRPSAKGQAASVS